MDSLISVNLLLKSNVYFLYEFPGKIQGSLCISEADLRVFLTEWLNLKAYDRTFLLIKKTDLQQKPQICGQLLHVVFTVRETEAGMFITIRQA